MKLSWDERNFHAQTIVPTHAEHLPVDMALPIYPKGKPWHHFPSHPTNNISDTQHCSSTMGRSFKTQPLKEMTRYPWPRLFPSPNIFASSRILLPLFSPSIHQLLSMQIILKRCSCKGQHVLMYNECFSKTPGAIKSSLK